MARCRARAEPSRDRASLAPAPRRASATSTFTHCGAAAFGTALQDASVHVIGVSPVNVSPVNTLRNQTSNGSFGRSGCSALARVVVLNCVTSASVSVCSGWSAKRSRRASASPIISGNSASRRKLPSMSNSRTPPRTIRGRPTPRSSRPITNRMSTPREACETWTHIGPCPFFRASPHSFMSHCDGSRSTDSSQRSSRTSGNSGSMSEVLTARRYWTASRST